MAIASHSARSQFIAAFAVVVWAAPLIVLFAGSAYAAECSPRSEYCGTVSRPEYKQAKAENAAGDLTRANFEAETDATGWYTVVRPGVRRYQYAAWTGGVRVRYVYDGQVWRSTKVWRIPSL